MHIKNTLAAIIAAATIATGAAASTNDAALEAAIMEASERNVELAGFQWGGSRSDRTAGFQWGGSRSDRTAALTWSSSKDGTKARAKSVIKTYDMVGLPINFRH